MAVPWTSWIIDNLRQSWHKDGNLRPSHTTASYTGGNPTAVTDLKPSIVDYATGNLKPGLVSGNELKASVKPKK